jgi:tetratricopeptide (TPR) repeat protein
VASVGVSSPGNFQPTDSLTSPRRRTLLLGLALALATLALYYPVHHHPFLNYDDSLYVTENDQVQAGLTWLTVKWAFTTFAVGTWHPLTWLSHALDCQWFGLDPAGHHDTSLLLHTFNVVLLFWVLQAATGYAGRSAMVAALFVLHPVNVESVAWIAERKNVLSMMFFLLALGAYGWYTRSVPEPSRGVPHPSHCRWEGGNIGRYLLVFVLFALGLLSKPQVITFPFVLLLWDYWPLQRMSFRGSQSGKPSGVATPTRSLYWLVVEKLPLFALSGASALITMAAARTDTEKIFYPRHIRIETAIVAYMQYLKHAFWPAHLAVFYPHPGGSLRPWHAYVALFLLGAITALVFEARSRRYLLVGWLWFLGTLVPMLGLQPVGYKGMQGIADRYAYLPCIGLFIMLCWGVPDLLAERTATSKRWLTGMGLALLLVMATLAHRQLTYWSDNVSLWSHTLQVTGPNWLAENNLGKLLMSEGREEEGITHLFRAVAIYPNDPVSNMNIALYEQKHGNLSEAVTHFKIAITMSHDERLKIAALNNLARAYTDLGDHERARECLAAAARLEQ